MSLMGKSACLWHAYNAVKEQGKGLVSSGQLKVFAHNLATNVGLSDVDFAEIGSSLELTDFLKFLSKTVFSRLPTTSPVSELLTGSQLQAQRQDLERLERIDEICWLICSKFYSDGTTINNSELYKLWRIFNALAEPSPVSGDENEAGFPVAMDSEEIELIVGRVASRLKTQFDVTELRSSDEDELISFGKFVDVIDKRCLIGRDEHVTSAVIGELYDDIIENVLKKGYLVKLRAGVGLTAGTSNEQCWCVLTPYCLRLYSRRDETEKRGDVHLSQSCRVENVSDKSGIAIGGIGIGMKTNCFVIHGAFDGQSVKTLEFSAPDVQTKSEWIQALQQAIGWSGSPVTSSYCVEVVRRRTKRAATRNRHNADQLRRLADKKMMAETLRQLEAERKAREEAEQKFMEEAKQRELEQQRIRDLEQLQKQLESLLVQERQAIRDEEIVRTLQAKVLQEEFDKREELESIKDELERLLAMEQSKSGELEEHRRRQEALYQYELERLKVLETERRRRDAEYEEAVFKLNDAERAKNQLRFELDRREMELRLQRGLLVRFNHADSVPTESVNAPTEMVSHRGRGAFIVLDEPNNPRSDNVSPIAVNTPSAVDSENNGSPSCFEQKTTSLNESTPGVTTEPEVVSIPSTPELYAK